MRKRPRGGPWVFDESFKRMAVEMSEAKGSVSAAAVELGRDAGHISTWRASFNKPDFREKVEGLTMHFSSYSSIWACCVTIKTILNLHILIIL